MTYTAASLLIVSVALITGVLTVLARRLVAYEVRRSHHEVGSAVFLQLGVIFAVLLAFVFNEVWGEYTVTATAINGECGSLRAAAVLADTLPEHARAPAIRAIAAYVAAVVDDEWPLMERRSDSVKATNHMRELYRAAARMDIDTPRAELMRGQMLTLIAQVYQQRETRLFQMTQGVPALVWTLLLAVAVVLVGFVVLSALEMRLSHYLLASLFAAVIAFMLVVIQLLDYPFEGAMRIPPTAFVQTQALETKLLPSG